MKKSKLIKPMPNLKPIQENFIKGDKNIEELVNSRFVIRRSASVKTKKLSSSLLVQMYSQENEILFI